MIHLFWSLWRWIQMLNTINLQRLAALDPAACRHGESIKILTLVRINHAALLETVVNKTTQSLYLPQTLKSTDIANNVGVDFEKFWSQIDSSHVLYQIKPICEDSHKASVALLVSRSPRNINSLWFLFAVSLDWSDILTLVTTAGEPLMTGEFPSQRASKGENITMSRFHDISMA